jgi:hypothetical protein
MKALRAFLLIGTALLLSSCGSEQVTAPDRPALDGGGYLGTGGRASDPPPTTTGDTTQVSGFGGGYLGTGG